MTGLREDTDLENCPFTKDLNFPKGRLSLSLPMSLSACMFPFNKVSTLFFIFCLLNLFLTRQARLGNVALIAGSCGTVVRTPCLGN